MSINHESDRKPQDIYEILGVDSTATCDTPSGEQPQDNPGNTPDLANDPMAPSGSMFENYANYRDNDPKYWNTFRILWIVGILTVVAILIGCFASAPTSFKSSTDSPFDEVREQTEEIAEAVEEVRDMEIPAVEAPAQPQLSEVYMAGTINGRYKIHLYLNLDAKKGMYYYDKSGASNSMILSVDNMEEYDGRYILDLSEYNPQGEICGTWHGTLTEDTFDGEGDYLGKPMPFSLTACPRSETGF